MSTSASVQVEVDIVVAVSGSSIWTAGGYNRSLISVGPDVIISITVISSSGWETESRN